MPPTEEGRMEPSRRPFVGPDADDDARSLGDHDPQVEQNTVQLKALLERVEARPEVEAETSGDVGPQSDSGRGLDLAPERAVVERVERYARLVRHAAAQDGQLELWSGRRITRRSR